MSTAKALPSSPAHTEELFEKDTLTKIKETHSKEIVIGLCGPIGSPLRGVAEVLKEILEQKYEYRPLVIKLSRFIEEYSGPVPSNPDRFYRYDYLIEKGNELKKEHTNAILAELAVRQISLRRAEDTPDDLEQPPPIRFCHILDSLKNIDEIEVLRAVYGRLFVLIGVHSSPEDRARSLKASGVSEKTISQLMDTDSGEDFAHGQEVRKAFPRSDFFVHAGDNNTTELKQSLERILHLITNTRIVSPTRSETAMYHAYAASMNSGCLSRQVGAAVTDVDGNIIGLGWNDVPKSGGGLYSEGITPDHRCMHRESGRCFNDLEKELVSELIANSVAAELVRFDEKLKPTVAAVRNDLKKAIKNSRIKDLIEFSRAVHAEMMAIIDAGSNANGGRLKGGKIYVTTYPCHSCARHIIAAGVQEIVFIEPYRKSLAIKLHSDALSEEAKGSGKVRIYPFEGVGPSRYSDFFHMVADRKGSDGKMLSVKHQTALFTAAASLQSLPSLEALILKQLDSRKLVRAGEKPQNPASA